MKLLKKKVNVFGKSIPVLAIFVLGIALVSAALVPYLSGLVIGTVDVQSPLVLTVGDSVATWNVDAENAFKPITQDFVLTNNAETPITAIIETNITGTDGSGKVNFDTGTGFGNEFETFLVGVDFSDVSDDKETTCNDDSGTWNGTEGYCYWDALNLKPGSTFSGVNDGVFYVQIGDRYTPQAIPAKYTMNARMKLQFKINVAPATYVFETQALTQFDSTNLDVDGFK